MIQKQSEYAASIRDSILETRSLSLHLDRSRNNVHLAIIMLAAGGIAVLSSGYMQFSTAWSAIDGFIFGLLGITIISGLGRHLFNDLHQRKEIRYYSMLLMFLTELSRDDTAEDFGSLPPDASSSTILMAIRHYSGIDLSLLNGLGLSSQDWEAAYNNTIKLWKDSEQEKETAIRTHVGAYCGMTLPVDIPLLQKSKPGRVCYYLSVVLGFLTIACFMMAIVMLVVALANINTNWWPPVKDIWDSLGVNAAVVYDLYL